MSQTFSWNRGSFLVNGQPTPLISGEFHYFRVPKADWEERLLLLKQSGANAVATYIPWIIHEPQEGQILFDDIPERSLTDFLRLCCKLEVMVIARPGPYAYSELCRDGLPFWMADTYPQVVAHGPNGEYCKEHLNASYLHPVFLEKARRYVAAVDQILRPFLATNGGCVVAVQADNEIGGIHIWRGFLDCNAEAMGFGKANGHYVQFLQEKYESIDRLNQRYGTAYTSFCEVLPYQNTPLDTTVGGKRFACDYLDFYRGTLEKYIDILCGWFAEDGIDVAYCTNAGTPNFIPLLRNLPTLQEKHRFFLGVDHYYTLGPAMGISMTPEKAVKFCNSLDMLEALGMPPSVLEMQSGSASAYPPVLPENAKAFYMQHIAFGLKGVNYYIFTGGPNLQGTGANVQTYDYHAPVSATGQVRPLYHAQAECNAYFNQNPWLLATPRSYDVQIGATWELLQQAVGGPWKRYARDGLQPHPYLSALQLTLAQAGGLYKSVELGGPLDPKTPLIVVSDQRMPKEKQEKLVAYIQNGGRVLFTPVLPELDEDFLPCTVLKDFLNVGDITCIPVEPLEMAGSEPLFEVNRLFTFAERGGKALVKTQSGQTVALHKTLGRGQVVLLGAEYAYTQFAHTTLLQTCLQALGYAPRVQTHCRDISAVLYEGQPQSTLFLINNLAGAVTGDFTVTAGGKTHQLQQITVEAMSVLPITLHQ